MSSHRNRNFKLFTYSLT